MVPATSKQKSMSVLPPEGKRTGEIKTTRISAVRAVTALNFESVGLGEVWKRQVVNGCRHAFELHGRGIQYCRLA